MNIDMQAVHERMMERLESMSNEELLVALEECEETDVGRALREGEEFIAQMDYETLVKCGIVKHSGGYGVDINKLDLIDKIL